MKGLTQKEDNKKQNNTNTGLVRSSPASANKSYLAGSPTDRLLSIVRDGGHPSSMYTGLRQQAVMNLQRTIGNQAVQRLIKSGDLQAKLKIGRSGDRYEQEADRVADAVMRMPEHRVQRQPEEEEELVQTKEVSGSTSDVTPVLETNLNALRGGGQPLPEADRSFMERRFGSNFSGVRVHTDSDAVQMNRELNAEAFTNGRDIYFGEGRYSPSTNSGQRLLAHELTHVVQQHSMEGIIRRSPVDEDECPSYQTGEISTSRTSSGHLDPDVTLHAPGQLLIADFGVSRQGVKRSTQAEPLLRSWLSTFESDNSYRLSITGYSDCVGSDSVNTRIRHGRAEQVERLLGAGARSRVTFRGMGGLGEFITDNNTVENRARNRGVAIEFRQEFTFPPRTVPGRPGCVTAVPGSSTPTSIGSRGACGSGADFRFFDFPTLGTADQIKVSVHRRLGDSALESIFRAELGALAGTVGNRMVTRFVAGMGGTLRHGLGSTISTLASPSRTMASATRSVQRDINSQLTRQAAGGTIDYNLLHPRLPIISFGFRAGTTLKGAIGGTQGLDLFIKDFTVPHCTRDYTATLRFEICDDFGVDTSDLYSPGLIAFWVLQHERRGHQPFINEIIVEKPISGRF